MVNNTRRPLQVNLRYAALFLGVLLFVPSPYLQTFRLLGLFYTYMRLLISPLIMIVWLIAYRRRSLIYVMLICFFYAWLTIVTIIRRNGFEQVETQIRYMIMGVSFIMLIDIYTGKDYFKTIQTTRLALEVLFWINVITVIWKPKGLYIAIEDNGNIGYFLGMRNNTIEVVIPMLGLLLFETHHLKKRRTHFLVCCIAALLTYIISSSANSLLCVGVFFVYAVLFLSKPPRRIFWLPGYAAIAAGFTVALALLGLQQHFRFFIVDVLGKNLTLSNRVRIWERAITYIAKSPFIGYGVENTMVKSLKIYAANSCHNYILDLLYYGGIILLLNMTLLFTMTVNKLYQDCTAKGAEVIGIGIASYFLLWIATPIHRGTICYMFLFWFLTYRCKDTEQSYYLRRRRLKIKFARRI